jgi:hypothetical protein
LQEEATPEQTPVSTLTRAVGQSLAQPDFDFINSKLTRQAAEAELVALENERAAEQEAEVRHFSEYIWFCGKKLETNYD